MILAGDIGGTNTRLCLVPVGASPRERTARTTYPSNGFPSLGAIVSRFLTETGARPVAAAFGVAGPVQNGKATATNLKWTIDVAELADRLGHEHVWIRNDLETTGLGLPWLAPAQLATLNAGEPWTDGNGCLIAAGTGLGESILVREADGGFRPIPSEGGHADFGPRDDEEDDLLRFLRRRFAPIATVSWERVVSGPGLLHLYEFARERAGQGDASLEARFATEPPARAITTAGLAGESALARAALSLFVRLYGAEASNLALKALATGGVWIGGGIAPRILPALTDGTFMAAFTANRTMSELLRRIPVHVVLEEDTSLLGAAALALERERSRRGGA